MGAVLERIDLDSTQVGFTSDHGDYAGHRGLLRKTPWIPFDDLARVPFVVAGPGIAGGRRVTSLVQSCDFALTCLDFAGVKAPQGIDFDTRSLRPLLSTRLRPRTSIVPCSRRRRWGGRWCVGAGTSSS